MFAGYNKYQTCTSQEQIIMSWKVHCQNKRSSRLTSTPFCGCQSPTSSFTKVSEMNVDTTAEWIHNLGKSKRWSEAGAYAQSFKNNNITGYLLDKLNTGSLKTELGITKYGHRIEIMAAINSLYSNVSSGGEKGNWKAKLLRNNCSANPSSNGHSTREGSCEGDIVSEVSYQNPTAACLWTGKPTGDLEDDYKHNLPPVCSSSFGVSNHAQEVQKWVQRGTKSSINRTWSNATLAYFCSTKRENPVADRVKARSKRARPGNHIAYKALHRVTIQKGKSFSSSIVGYLIENSIVLINQIKGRRGRIVLKKPNGKLLAIGWVPLFTSKGQQLLAKHNKKGGAEIQNSDATIEWRSNSPLEDLNQSTASDSEFNGSQVEVLRNETALNTDSKEAQTSTKREGSLMDVLKNQTSFNTDGSEAQSNITTEQQLSYSAERIIGDHNLERSIKPIADKDTENNVTDL